MKNLILSAVLLFAISASSQNTFFSGYNKGKKSVLKEGYWAFNKGSEIIYYNTTPTGYKKILDELKDVLAFYGKNIDSEHYDDSLFYDNESIFDYQKIYINCYLKNSQVTKVWRTKSVSIVWMVTDETCFVMLSKIK